MFVNAAHAEYVRNTFPLGIKVASGSPIGHITGDWTVTEHILAPEIQMYLIAVEKMVGNRFMRRIHSVDQLNKFCFGE